jgi:hypothetical protein
MIRIDGKIVDLASNRDCCHSRAPILNLSGVARNQAAIGITATNSKWKAGFARRCLSTSERTARDLREGGTEK